MTTPNESASVTVKTPKPPGVLPKHLREMALGGVALAMVIIIALSNRTAPKARPDVAPTPTFGAVNPTEERIEAYKKQLDEQAQALARDEAAASRAQRVIGGAPGSQRRDITAAEDVSPDGRFAESERPWIELDFEKRAYQSRYASNIVQTKRSHDDVVGVQVPEAPLLNATTSPVPAADRYRLAEGTVIETVLTNRLDSSFAGPVNTLVTTNVYSRDRAKVLIPRGSRILGSAARVDSIGQQRLAVTFSTLILPNGQELNLETFPGLSQVGETGLLDKVNHHYAQIFGVSLAIGAIAGLSEANTSYGVNTSAEDAYRQGVGRSLSQSSLNILDRFLNVLPTFTIREGIRIKVYLTAGLDLPAYDPDATPGRLP